MDKTYSEEGCLRLMDALITQMFNTSHKTYWRKLEDFMASPLFQSWCDVREFDPERIKSQLRASMLGKKPMITATLPFRKKILNP